MSEVPPIGLATKYLLLLPVLSPNCTVYNHLPVSRWKYSRDSWWQISSLRE
jgi:hypothetical protein